MKLFIFLLLMLPSLALSQEFTDPSLSAKKITDIANNYLVSEKKINLNEYTLESVSFDYLQAHGKENYWYVSYFKKQNKDGYVGLGSHFSIRLNNSKKPEIKFISGI